MFGSQEFSELLKTNLMFEEIALADLDVRWGHQPQGELDFPCG
tara:strand:- start:82 stop:210 length:129 start_codon:yes stop_codon:yes gene_type:complete